MPTRITVTIDSLTCLNCGTILNVKQLETLDGRCECNSDVFDTAVRVRKTSTPDADATIKIATGIWVGGIAGASLAAEGAEQYATSESEYNLSSLPGSAIIELVNLPPQKALEWITLMRKEAAKANLQPNQLLCIECDDIFTKAMSGPSAEGFCSPLCKRKHAHKQGIPAEKPPAAAGKVQSSVVKLLCPGCNKPVKVKVFTGGGPYKCMWCGTGLQMN